MLPRSHLIIGGICSSLLIYFFHVPLLAGITIFLSSFLIDIDHYFWFVYKKRDFNPFRARRYFFNFGDVWRKIPVPKRKNYRRAILIFHGIEFWVILFGLSFLNIIFLWILAGVMIHIIADLIKLFVDKEPISSKLSVCLVANLNKNKHELKI